MEKTNYMESTLKLDWTRPDSPVDMDALETQIVEAGKRLEHLSSAQIVSVFDDLSKSLLTRENPLLHSYPSAGLPFLARMCQAEGFSLEVADALGGLDCLDDFIPRKYVAGYEKRAYPKGIVGHWIAGNVPTLALISLLSSLMTKNANIVRLPSAADNFLPCLLRHLHGLGEAHSVVASAVTVVRYDFNDTVTADRLSLMADVRIIWGGDESSSKVKALPCKLNCQDLIFPDRTSFAVIGKSGLAPEKISGTTRLLAHDISVFEQKACASPHTVFLATDSDLELEFFCTNLFEALAGMLKIIPKTPPTPLELSAILNLRSQYDMFYDAWYPDEVHFSILSDSEIKIGPPIGNRTIFVRKLPSCEELAQILPGTIQSVGVAAEGFEFEELTQSLGRAGVHRFTPLGGMTHFSLPWDGMFIPQSLVRWVTRSTHGSECGVES